MRCSRRDLLRRGALGAGIAVRAGPVASIRLPQRVPYGFHAAWVPG